MTFSPRALGSTSLAGDTPRLLLVGSDAGSTGALQRDFTAGGYDVVHVQSYESGLALLTADVPVDAVVLDIAAASDRDLDVCRRYRLWNLFPGIATVVLLDAERTPIEGLGESGRRSTLQAVSARNLAGAGPRRGGGGGFP